MNKIQMPMLFLFIDFMVFAILYETDHLSEPLSYFLIAIGIGIFLWSLSMRSMITFEEARQLCEDTALRMQRLGQLPHGTFRLKPETELKYLLLHGEGSDMLEPDHWEVGCEIDGDKLYGYVYSVSVYGETGSFSEINVPSSYRVTRKKRIEEFQARTKVRPQELKEEGQKKAERARDKNEDDDY